MRILYFVMDRDSASRLHASSKKSFIVYSRRKAKKGESKTDIVIHGVFKITDRRRPTGYPKIESIEQSLTGAGQSASQATGLTSDISE